MMQGRFWRFYNAGWIFSEQIDLKAISKHIGFSNYFRFGFYQAIV